MHRDLHIDAVVGKDTRIYGHIRLSKDCEQGPIPAMKVVKQPANGTPTTRVEAVTLTQSDFGTCSAGRSGQGRVVYYRAMKPGDDSFEYQMSSPGLPTTVWSITVTTR